MFELCRTITWQKIAQGQWVYDVALSADFSVSGGRVLPSLSMGGAYSWQASLWQGDTERARTLAIGGNLSHFPAAFDSPSQGVRQKLDNFEIDGAAATQNLHLKIICRAENIPQDAFFALSCAPLTISLSGNISPRERLCVPARSQMEAEDSALQKRICAPTSIAMVLDYYKIAFDFNELQRACHHDGANIYGVWPQNIWAASQFELKGMVRIFENSADIDMYLAQNIPIIASIKYTDGALHNAPMPHTDGHLMVICGSEGDDILVNDPAAADKNSVSRAYNQAEFIRAWQNHGCVGYVLGI